MKLILFATYGEAAKTIEYLQAKVDSKEMIEGWKEAPSPALFSYSEGYIAITGIGCLAAACAVFRYGHMATEILNLGLAGSLSDAYPLGSIHSISAVGKYTHTPTSLDSTSKECLDLQFQPLKTGHEGLRLISVDFPVHDPILRPCLEATGDLVDMEGYGVAFAAKRLNKPYSLRKIVSDFINPDGRALISQHKKRLSELLQSQF